MQCLVLFMVLLCKIKNNCIFQSIEQKFHQPQDKPLNVKADIRNPLPLLNSNCMNWGQKNTPSKKKSLSFFFKKSA